MLDRVEQTNIPVSTEKETISLLKKQMLFSCISMALIAVIALVLVIMVVRVSSVVDTAVVQVTDTVNRANTLLDSAQGAVQDLSVVAADLKEVSWADLSQNIDDTVVIAQESLSGVNEIMDDAGSALKTIGDLDIESLNKAIGNLSAIVEPLAKLFGHK